uniref:Protein kinase domain-containing protein n=1 Tax=Panagrolaimus sp. ES5 TaxID=591445 RepID=A0AC34FXC5_9BILA
MATKESSLVNQKFGENIDDKNEFSNVSLMSNQKNLNLFYDQKSTTSSRSSDKKSDCNEKIRMEKVLWKKPVDFMDKLPLRLAADIKAFEKTGGIVCLGKCYEYIRQLEKGAFGVVDLMKEHGSNKLVAVKTVEKVTETLGPAVDFDIEYNTMKKLKNLNIFECFSGYITEDRVILILEFCAEGSLQGYIEKESNGIDHEAVLCLFGAQIISGLNYLQQKHVIHRDFKPANILLSNVTAKIAEFGIAKVLTAKGEILHSDVGAAVYKAPEIGIRRYASKEAGMAKKEEFQKLVEEMPERQSAGSDSDGSEDEEDIPPEQNEYPEERIAYYQKNIKNDNFSLNHAGKLFYHTDTVKWTCQRKNKCKGAINGYKIDDHRFFVEGTVPHSARCG